jgi:APA family basic amino acid/polyamine antiporter
LEWASVVLLVSEHEITLSYSQIFIYFLGTGIFVLSGQAAAEYAGPSIIISFIIAGIAALLSALSMSEMSSMMSGSGSVYTYTYVGELMIFFVFSKLNHYLFFALSILAMGGMLKQSIIVKKED